MHVFEFPVPQHMSSFPAWPSQVKIHYTLEGQTQVIATISANVATLDFIRRGLPGQPEGVPSLLVSKALIPSPTNHCIHCLQYQR